MPIFNKLLHSSIRNKLSKNVHDNLKKIEIEAKNTEYVNYIPIKYESSKKIDYICSINNAVIYSDCGFIFIDDGKLIKYDYIWSNIWIYV